MKLREHRPGHESSPQTAPRRERAVAPGKRTLTMGVPSRQSAGAAPLQRRPATPLSSAPRSRAAEGPVEDWMAVAMRPDLHQEPILRKSMDQIGYAAADAPSASATSGGQAMPAAVQAKMERSFGADFSAVRIHQGPEAQSIGALAYTQGSSIHFAPGQYEPGSQRGQELLGHELAHVVQQAQGRVSATTQAKGACINDDARLEQEADEMGARAARGEPTASGGAQPVPATTMASMPASSTVQRKLERKESGGYVHYVDTRDNRLRPPFVFREVGELTFTDLNTNVTITYSPYTAQLTTSTGGFLDPVSHRHLQYEQTSGCYIDEQGTFYEYVYENGDYYYRPLPERTLAKDAQDIEGAARYEGGIWATGRILLDGRSCGRTQFSRHGQESHQNNPYSSTHVHDKGLDPQEVQRSRSDAEVDTLYELEEILKGLISDETNAPEEVRVVITGNVGPCNECKARIEAFAERVQKLVNRTQRTNMRQFALIVESRYLNPNTAPLQGERNTRYGYPDEQQIQTGGLVGYRKFVVIDAIH
jgi:hypothetical protein